MIEVWVMRHGHKVGEALELPLTKEGAEQIREIAQSLRVRFESIIASLAVRTYQTAMIIVQVLGTPWPKIDSGLTGGDFDRWIKLIREIHARQKGQETLMDFLRADSEFIKSEGGLAWDVIRTTAINDLTDGQRALCVSHCGQIEAAMTWALASLNGLSFEDNFRQVTQMLEVGLVREGEIVIFQFNDDHQFVGFGGNLQEAA